MKWGQKTVDREDHTVDQSIKINLSHATGQIGKRQAQLNRIEAKLDKLLQQQTKSRTL